MRKSELKRRKPLRTRSNLKPGKPMVRGGRMKRKVSPNEFPETVKANVRRRSGNACEAQSSVCTGRATCFHHRKRRREGDNSEANCLHMCDSCHSYAHSHVVMAMLMGWICSFAKDPAEIPVRRGSAA